MQEGLYIVYEGCDGVGKTTLSQKTHDYLSTLGYKNTLTRHPGATSLGQKLRHIIKHDQEVTVDPFTERLLFLCDNSAFVNTILIPSIKRGETVIADRCNFISDLAYGRACGVSEDLIFKGHAMIQAPKIDLMFILWCPWEIAKPRMINRNDELKCKIEARGDNFFKDVNELYKHMTVEGSTLQTQAMKYTKKLIAIDASEPANIVWEKVKNIIKSQMES